MTYATESIALQTRFRDKWGNTTEVHWPNVAFESADKSEWVRFRILNEQSRQAGIGGETHLYRYPGFVSVIIFTKPNIGSARALFLADKVEDAFRGADFSGIKMGVPSSTQIGVVDGMYQTNVLCPFYRDEIKSRSL
jgi:hypothetical protein